MDELDRILLNEPPLEPHARFRSRVMRQVRADRQQSLGLEFPWMRLIMGGIACVSAILLGVLLSSNPVILAAAPPAAMWTLLMVIMMVLFVRLMLDWAG